MSIRLRLIDAAIAANFPGLLSVSTRVVDRNLIFIDVESAGRKNELLDGIRTWAMVGLIPAGYAVVVQWRAF